MDVVVLGPLSSASTWAFNVVRKILSSQPGKRVYSVFAEEAAAFLSHVPRPYDDCVVKAHALDAAFLALTDSPNCRVIVTTRDPLDIVASAQARFGLEPLRTLRSLSRTVASIRQLPETDRLLHLAYEQGAAQRAGSISQIAKFLGVLLPTGAAERIFEEFRHDNVKALIDARAQSPAHAFHPLPHHTTQWHLGHVSRDARSGDPACAQWKPAVEAAAALVGWRPDDAGKAFVRPELFQYGDHFADDSGRLVYCDGAARHVVYGPYLHLQPGVWEAKLRFHGVDDSPPLRLSLDAYAKIRLATTTLVVAPERAQDVVLRFDHFDHLEPVELRVETVADGRMGKFRFLGAELEHKGVGQRRDYLLSVAEATPEEAAVPFLPLARWFAVR